MDMQWCIFKNVNIYLKKHLSTGFVYEVWFRIIFDIIIDYNEESIPLYGLINDESAHWK